MFAQANQILAENHLEQNVHCLINTVEQTQNQVTQDQILEKVCEESKSKVKDVLKFENYDMILNINALLSTTSSNLDSILTKIER